MGHFTCPIVFFYVDITERYCVHEDYNRYDKNALLCTFIINCIYEV